MRFMKREAEFDDSVEKKDKGNMSGAKHCSHVYNYEKVNVVYVNWLWLN